MLLSIFLKTFSSPFYDLGKYHEPLVFKDKNMKSKHDFCTFLLSFAAYFHSRSKAHLWVKKNADTS